MIFCVISLIAIGGRVQYDIGMDRIAFLLLMTVLLVPPQRLKSKRKVHIYLHFISFLTVLYVHPERWKENKLFTQGLLFVVHVPTCVYLKISFILPFGVTFHLKLNL